ncbi:MAG: NADH-quinone oxidoreductase subunit J [bacterium]|nr:NADH-quinone oxidoreductase subunit J [bacterium]
MLVYFYINGAIAVLATALTIMAKNAVHALLYFVVSLLSLAVAMYLIGAPFAAALEVIIYAGAIMVLFVFVVMLLNIKPLSSQKYNAQNILKTYLGPFLLFVLLLLEFSLVMNNADFAKTSIVVVSAKDVAKSLFTAYTLVIELVSLLLLAGLIGAYHVGKKRD